MTLLFYPSDLRPRSYIYTEQDRIDLMGSNIQALPPVLRSALEPENPPTLPAPVSPPTQSPEEDDASSKPTIPRIYWRWDRLMETGSRLVHFNHIDMLPEYKKTARITYIVHVAIPTLFLIGFVALEIVFLLYLVWFFWIGFIFLVLIFYRTKDYFEMMHYIGHPEAYQASLPTYTPGQFSQSMTQLSNPPPPNYIQAQSLPPPYASIP